MSRPALPGTRITAFILIVAFTITVSWQEGAFASHAGSSTASAGSSLPPVMQAVESFQPDLSTGRATLGLPIPVPPGRRGLQPAISVGYSSSARNGPLGVGWSLEMGSIERSTRNGIPSYTSSDTCVLKYGGTQADLIEVAPGQFRPKDEQLFAKILFNGTYWTLTSKDGSIATFGATADSRLSTSFGTAAWHLNDVQDIHGNRMTFSYLTNSRQVYPEKILYTGHPATGLNPAHEVRFTWGSRPDVSSDLRFREEVRTAWRLAAIETFTSGTLVRRCQFGYTASPRSGRSLLTQFTVVGSDGATALPATTFTYHSAAPTYAWQPFGSPPVIKPDLGGDFNGDGLSDAAHYTTGGALEVSLSNGTALQPKSIWLTWGSSSKIPVMGDFNGDGLTDVIFYTPYTGFGSGSMQFFQSGGSGAFAGSWAASMNENEIPLVGDFNGDGITDIGSFSKPLGRFSVALCRNANQPPLPQSTWLSGWGVNYDPILGDFNGDGLTDVGVTSGGEVAIAFSTGTAFVPAGGGGSQFAYYPHTTADVNGDGLTDLVYFDTNSFTPKVHRSDGSGGFTSAETIDAYMALSTPKFQMADLNGDGLADPGVYNDNNQGGTAWSSGLPCDLLISTANGLGGTTTLTYKPSTQYDNRGGDTLSDLPFVTQTVSSQTISNGMGWSAATTYTYAGGRFDSVEKEFLGFAWARVTDPVGAVAESWFHQDPHLKGRPWKQEAKDSAGRLFTRTENAWACRSLYEGPSGHVHFCHLASTTSTLFDGNASSKQTKVEYEYDSSGNVTLERRLGDTSVTGDELTTTTEYALNSTLWLIGFPSHTKTQDAAQNTLAESWIFYDGAAAYTTPPVKGLPTRTESWLNTGPANPAATATYDTYGNKLTSTDPLNRTTTTEYDPALKTFPVRVTNHLSHTLQTTYDPGTGQLLTTTDPNGQVTTNFYDPLGRLVRVVGPLDTSAEPSVIYSYDLSATPSRVVKQVKQSAGPPAGYYTTYSFADGLGRTIQTRAPAEDTAKQIVTGNVVFGPRGETAAQYLPYFENLSTSWVAPDPALPKVLYQHDAMGRTTRVTDADGAVTQTGYDDWTVTVTDPNNNTVTRLSDAYGRLVQVTEPATADHGGSTTSYTYDPAGRLTRVTDAAGSQTRITYDSLGRKLTMDDPDMGHWEYRYDPAGNLTQQTDAKGQILEFSYDALNRVTQKTGRANAGASPLLIAAYTYDAPAKPNCIGRLSKAADQTGSTEFWYDTLGRETKTEKIISGHSYVVEREYDPLNRLTRLIYPDGTDLRYAYSPQGINRIWSTAQGGVESNYLVNADFNAAGETLRMGLGNNVTTDYTYNPQTLRIQSIRTRDAANRTLQDFTYAFDPVGNLTQLNDNANSADQIFTYDQINRLKTASGAYGSFRYRYNAIGNLLEKDNGAALSYGQTGGVKPHAVTRLTLPGQSPIDLSYDANGNMTLKGDQTVSYDLQNRPKEIHTFTGRTGTITKVLQPGWNCVGLPFATGAQPIHQVLSSLTLGTHYDQVSLVTNPGNPTRPWSSFVGDADANETSTLHFGKGFWIHVTAASSVTLSLSGATPKPRQTISLTTGWNLIACPLMATGSASQALAGLTQGVDYSEIKRWNELSQQFEPVTGPVQPGDALMVQMLVSRNWEVPTPIDDIATTFSYDGDGGRVSMTVSAGGGIETTTYVGKLFEVLSGGVTRSHVYFGSTLITTIERSSGLFSRASYEAIHGQLLPGERLHRRFGRTMLAAAREASFGSTPGRRIQPRRTLLASTRRALTGVRDYFLGTAYADPPAPGSIALKFYHPDHLGSVNLITDENGAQLRLNEFSPFGALSRGEGSTDLPHKFTGKRLDASTGLYYYGARYYDPELGRFIQPDTIVQAPSDPQTLNRYTYVRNNPLIYTDPTGHSFWKKVKKFFKNFGSSLLQIAGYALAPFTGGWSLLLVAAGMGISAYQANRAGQLGAWFAGAAVSMAIGFAFPMSDIVNPGMRMAMGALRGAAIGAIAGGVASVVGGGSFGAGALQGALGGAAGGALSGLITSQHYQNWAAGNGFKSNAAVIAAALTEAAQDGNLQLVSDIDRNTNTYALRNARTQETYEGVGGFASTHYPRDPGPGSGAGRSTAFRYVGPTEAANIQRTGTVSNIDVRGDPKPVFVTFDNPMNSGAAARSTYGLSTTPTHRVTVDTTGIKLDYGGNVRAGSTATEATTRQPIRAIEVKPLDD